MYLAGRSGPCCAAGDRRLTASTRGPACLAPCVSRAIQTDRHVTCSSAPGQFFPSPVPSSRRAFLAAAASPKAASQPTSSSTSATPAQGEVLAQVPNTANGKLISRTEVAAFIQRDDMMDQMYRWAIIEAGEGGVQNFGLPMDVEPFYNQVGSDTVLWGYRVGVFKEGIKLCDLGVMFDKETVDKHEWVGRGEDGFPVLEGRVDHVIGKNFEIWKLDANPVDETLRSAIRAFCTGLVTALNRYYAFGSVFVDDAQ